MTYRELQLADCNHHNLPDNLFPDIEYSVILKKEQEKYRLMKNFISLYFHLIIPVYSSMYKLYPYSCTSFTTS